jgi:hypothetical protein
MKMTWLTDWTLAAGFTVRVAVAVALAPAPVAVAV